jgi:GDP-mannose mannosyl hydrolase
MPIVCVDCLVVNDVGNYLLVKRKNEPLKGEYWVPGGRLHKNERLVDAVQRKMREEIGVEVEILESLGFFEEFFEHTAEDAPGGAHSISLLYLVKPKSYDIRLDDQSVEWGWFKDIPQRLKQYPGLSIPDIEQSQCGRGFDRT